MSEKRIAAVVGLLWVVGVAVPVARAEDRKAAAEHFALAEAAEKRKDWGAAIAEYELAYVASPHPWALFNIATNYQRLGQGRNAATYFRRYLDESPDAKDRAEVEARIETLRSLPSQLSIQANPPSAMVWIDGEQRGPAPQTVKLRAGEHEVAISHGGRRSPVRKVTVEYGDPVALTIDLDAAPGLLVVDGEVAGAEIRVDGEVIGYTPYTGAITAGPHQILISKPGYQTLQREITIAPDGSQQIRANLTPVAGSAAAKPPAYAHFLLGMGYGWDLKSDGIRYLFELGYRAGSRRWEVSALFGALGGQGAGVGIGGRLFLGTGRVRPYLHAGAFLAASSSESERQTLVEGGAGVLIAGSAMGSSTSSGAPRLRMNLDYFVEVDFDAQLSEPTADETRYGVPIVAGVVLLYGR